MIKNPYLWTAVIALIVVPLFAILFGENVTGSLMINLAYIPLICASYFAMVRLGMFLTFLSQKDYVQRLKENDNAVSIIIGSLLIGVAIVTAAGISG